MQEFFKQEYIQLGFYIISPIATFLAVATAYLAIYRQSKPNIVVYYETSEAGSVIDLVICNHGNGTAKNLEFSKALPINCWGIENAEHVSKSDFFNSKIPLLAPGKELRYQAGQYGGLSSVIKESYSLEATYTYKTPLGSKKSGVDTLVLDIRYMSQMHSKNSAALDLSDALKGRNNTIFVELNRSLKSINTTLTNISKKLDRKDENDA